jgi:hypothetical protein
MTNYEYLRAIIDNKAAVENFFCRMIELSMDEEVDCSEVCPMAKRCWRAHGGFKAWLDEEHETPMPDWGKYR